jgi:hypothetical protein
MMRMGERIRVLRRERNRLADENERLREAIETHLSRKVAGDAQGEGPDQYSVDDADRDLWAVLDREGDPYRMNPPAQYSRTYEVTFRVRGEGYRCSICGTTDPWHLDREGEE